MFLDIPTTTIDYDSIPDDISRIALKTANHILIEIYAMNAQAELERNRKRCDDGREVMKARGEWDRYGRPRIFTKHEFSSLYARVLNGEIKSLELMRKLGLTNSTYFRYVREYRDSISETLNENNDSLPKENPA